MGIAIIRITERPYTVIIQTGSKEPGLGKMATMSKGPYKSLEMQLGYSPFPGSDEWQVQVTGLLPVMQGTWVLGDDSIWSRGFGVVYLSGPDVGRFLYLKPYVGAGVLGPSWRGWPDNPFRRGLTGTGGRIGPTNAGTLNPACDWECVSAD
jgi:hypothetical protein